MLQKYDLKRVEGIVFGLTAQVLFGVTPGIIRVIYQRNARIREYELVYWKSLTMLPMNYLYARSHGVFVTDVPPKYRKIIITRALVGFFGVGGFWFALEFLPVSIAATIAALGTMFTTLFAYLFLKESITKVDIFSFVLCFLGVLIINMPALAAESQNAEEKRERTVQDYIFGSLLALSCALATGVIQCCMRYMNQGIHYCISPFWFASGCTFMSPLFYVLAHKLHWKEPSPAEMAESQMPAVYDWVVILLIGVVSVITFLGQVFMSRAFQLEKSSIIATFNYTGTVIGFIIDIFFFKVTLHRTDIIGSLLIISVLLTIAILKAVGAIK